MAPRLWQQQSKLRLRRERPSNGSRAVSGFLTRRHLKVFADDSFWVIPNVRYGDEILPVDLLKTPLEGGVERCQDDLAYYSFLKKQEGDFYAPDMPLCYAVIAALSNPRDSDQINARNFMRGQIRRGIMTLTGLCYSPSELDEVTHNLEMENEYRLSVDLSAPVSRLVPDYMTYEHKPFGELLDVGCTPIYLGAVLATKYPSDAIRYLGRFGKINDVYSWRLERPQVREMCAAGFSSSPEAINIDLNLSLRQKLPSLGVRVHR
jgi:hypothetical protein